MDDHNSRIERVNMPEALRAIYDEVRKTQLPASNVDGLQQRWETHIANVQAKIPDVHIEGHGETLYLGDLSPGCQACKAGTWDCIFVTMQCNLDCDFCYSPHAIPKAYKGSAFGSTLEQIAQNYAKTPITGISFSGGEPFLYPQRLLEWVTWFKARFPTCYYWAYTNGLLADETIVGALGDIGLDEIRFDMAATGYNNPVVMQHVQVATRHIPQVTVEIPAIPRDAPTLLASLAPWAKAGVRFINLHELMYEPGTNAASLAGERLAVVTRDGHRTAINPYSRALTLAVMEEVQHQDLPLSVNDCSLQSKLLQLRGRRRCFMPLVKAPHEKLTKGWLYESYCAYREGGQIIDYVHPDAIAEIQRRYPDAQWVKLARIAPMAINSPSQWVGFTIQGALANG